MANKKVWISWLIGGATGGAGIFGLTICCLPVAAAFPGILGIISVFLYSYSKYLLAIGITFLLLSIFLFIRRRKCKAVQLIATLRCPYCGFEKAEAMPTDACVYFYDCTGCGRRFSPKPGDCCVFCSYGTVKCPSKQAEGGCSHE